jgi:hypothetical protein
MLADFINIPRSTMHMYLNMKDDGLFIKNIKDAIDYQGERIIQINCSKFKDEWYVYAFSTEAHVIVPFNEIKKIVIGKWGEIEESDYGNAKVYEKKIRSIETSIDKFDVLLRCTSGRNIKTSAMKVIVLLRVKSCMNSVIGAEYESVKHTENWKHRLEQYLDTALFFATTVETTLNKGMNRELTLEQGINYINYINYIKISLSAKGFPVQRQKCIYI